MAEPNKETIYIDIDDEITAIIDKVRASSSKVVAMVLPKRATTLQSVVNMKLLKRTADETKKNLVLITTESGLMPLAGAVGLHVAATPNSRPEIPAGPAGLSDAEEQVDEVDLADDSSLDGDKTIGELAGATMPLPTKPLSDNTIETLELDNADPLPAASKPLGTPKQKKDKKLSVPNFDRFRALLIIGALVLIALIVGGYFALAVLPKATIAIKTNASNINSDVNFTLSTTATNLNTSSNIVPAKQVQTQKTLTGMANATGQKNNGEKAHGQVTLSSACSNGVQTIPSGTGLSSSGLTYITQRDVTLSSASGGRTNCTFSGTVEITAQTGGAKYNNSDNSSYSVSSSSTGAYTASSITGKGSADGGTDDIQTVISQADIDSAKGKITSGDNAAQDDLKKQLEDQGLFAVAATYNAGEPSSSNSANVGDAANAVTVTQTITYGMLGVNQDYVKTLVDNDIKSQIDTSMQGILSEGITQSAFKLKNAVTNGASMNIQTTATVGPSINVADVTKNAAGKKAGDIKADIKANPDVTDVTVKLSPFWVNKAPKNTSKITVTIAKPTAENDN